MIVEEAVYSDLNVQDFLAHHGVKGMRWGVRRTARIQRVLDRHERIAKGTASTGDKLLGANRFIFTKKQAAKSLERGAYQQEKILHGRGIVKGLLKAEAINVEDLNYHTKKTTAGREKFKKRARRGKLAAAGILVAYGGLKVAQDFGGAP